jgi:imidazolonepropionase-like amidohydrolase
MGWRITAVSLPDGDRPIDVWVDDAGRLVDAAVPGAELLPGRFVVPGLVDSHAHPAVRGSSHGPVARDVAGVVEVLSQWSATGIGLVRDVGSPGGVTLDVRSAPGLPTVLAAGRFLAPEDRYFPGLLPEPAPAELLTDLALGELARGASWVKVIGDFPAFVDGWPVGALEQTYPHEALAAMVAAVHSAGGRVAVHSTMEDVASLVRLGVDSIEHGIAMDESCLALMAETGAAWTPTLNAVLRLLRDAPEHRRRRLEDFRDQLQNLLPLAVKLGVPVLAGTDTAGSIVDEIVALVKYGLEPAAALASASTTALAFLGETSSASGRRATLVTYAADPREDLAVLSDPLAVVIDGIRLH